MGGVVLSQPDVDELDGVVQMLREWQDDRAPMQLHPGDLGWFWRHGATATADAVRLWRRRGQIVGIGLLDGSDLLRLTLSPDAHQDQELAEQIAGDVAMPDRGVLGEREVALEVPAGALVRELLLGLGWCRGDAWTPLRRELNQPAPPVDLRIELVGPADVEARVTLHLAAFKRSTFTEGGWHAMALGSAYRDARCLVGYDGDTAVAAVTVWSAGAGKPGLLEPMGVPPEHRGRGYGRAIVLAAAAALHDLGSSSALVCTPCANIGGVATYVSAGFVQLPIRYDVCREAIT